MIEIELLQPTAVSVRNIERSALDRYIAFKSHQNGVILYYVVD